LRVNGEVVELEGEMLLLGEKAVRRRRREVLEVRSGVKVVKRLGREGILAGLLVELMV
jgi:hypothetical protein